MSLVIKKHAHTRASTAEIFRGIAKLSDGKFAVLTFNSNITAKSGSSSEKNDTPKLYVTVYNSDWTTFLSAGIQVGTAKTKQTLGEIASMAIDSSNNIHIAYIYRTSPDNSSRLLQGQSLRYRKITYNGTTLSIGSESTVYSITGYYTGVDIEVPLGATLNDNPLIGFVHTVDGAIHKTRLTQLSVGSTTQIESVTSAGRGVSIALNNTVNTASYKWLAATYQLEAGNDVGDAIVYGTGTTTSAPVISTILAQNLNVGLGDGLRHIAAFRTGNVFIITGPVAANPYTHFVASYAIPVSGSPAITLSPQNISVGDKYVANAGYLFAGVQLDATDGAIITHISDGKNIYAQVLNYSIDVGETALTLVKQDLKWKMDQHYLGKNVAPSLLYTGDRSRNGTSDIGVIVDYPDAYLYVLYNREPASGKITTVMTTPATNGSINKSNPTIVAQVSGSSNNNIVGAVDFQTSKDANFITEVHDFLSDYQTFLKSVSVKINLPEASLSQGQFYSRMRIVDQLGYAYDWNTVQPFTSAHKPTAAILSPERGAVAIYNGDGTVTFNIGFTDPDSTASQTAYRIQVTDLSGTVIADTGKIVSNAATINVTMSSSNLNADLIVNAWVWDEDDVMSDPTSSDFMLATLPSVLMDYPLVNTAVTTATPVYSWNDTLPAGRTQEKYRIFVRKAVDNSLIWDSGILDGDGDTLQQEAGYLKNSTNYAVTVWIEDNIGMTASNSVTFPTLWVKPPACTSPYVDISLYDELGYAYVTMVPPTVSDLAHTKIALMRRSLFSNSDWELIEALQMGVGLNYSVIDSTLPSGVDTFYAAVLQVDTGGDLSIGDPDDSGQMKISTPSGRYWLVSLDNPENNTIIPIVTSDSYSDERESETIVIVDRGRWIDVGDDIGVTGTLNSKIYNRDVGLGNNPVMNYLHNPRLLSTGVGLTGIASWTRGATRSRRSSRWNCRGARSRRWGCG